MQLYAIINTGGHEYRVTPGKKVKVDRLEAEPGEIMEFSEVSKLVNGDQVVEGAPTVKGARVRASVVKHGQEKGIIVFKMKRRQLYQKKHDSQWQFTTIKIDEIVFEDNTFDKRDVDPKKIKKAAAAAAVEAKKTRPVPAPVPTPQPVAKTPEPKQPEPVAPAPVVAPAVATKPAVAEAHQPAEQKSRVWIGALLLLALIALGLFFWNQSPTPVATATTEPVVEPRPADVRLLTTRQIDRPADPAQPPD